MSLLSQRVFADERFSKLSSATTLKFKQQVIDEITADLVVEMDPQVIAAHIKSVTDAVAQKHTDTAYKEDIPLELLHFMRRIPNGGRVLDAGCGSGRDSLFMACGDQIFRHKFIKSKTGARTLWKKYEIFKKTFQVISVDISAKMIEEAKKKRNAIIKNPNKRMENPNFFLRDWRDLNSHFFSNPLDGIWSWMSLSACTPLAWFEREFKTMSKFLKPGGILFLHYVNGRRAGGYDKLTLLPNNLIEYSSQPSPRQVTNTTESCGLKLINSFYTDHKNASGEIITNMKAYQFFEKI